MTKIKEVVKVKAVGVLMKNLIIDEIFSIEDEADRIIEKAQEEAKDINLKAETEAHGIIQELVDKTRSEDREKLDEASKLLSKHIAEYENQRIEIEKSESRIDTVSLDEAVKEAVERISKVG